MATHYGARENIKRGTDIHTIEKKIREKGGLAYERRHNLVITIDGPTASGKSSTAMAVAQKLGFYYLNTGFLYRALTYLLLTTRGYSQADLSNVRQEDIELCTSSDYFSYTYNAATGYSVTYKGTDITPFLKDATIDTFVAIISPQKLVRHAITEQQRSLAGKHSIVVDGRDVGSHVFPFAQYKFYLTASLNIRAQRWRHDQALRGNNYTLEEAEQRIHERDLSDEQREISPLVIPSRAVIIDNSLMTREETVQKIISYIGNFAV